MNAIQKPSLVAKTLFLIALVASPALAQEAKSEPLSGAKAPAESTTPAAGTTALAAKPAIAKEDGDAIRKSSREFAEAFNRGDAKALAGMWHEDGEYTDEDGNQISGRAAIEAEYVKFLADHKGCRIQFSIDSIRPLGSDTAIEDGHAVLDPNGKGAPSMSKYQAIHVKTNGKWQMHSVHDSRVDPASANKNLSSLEWLIGSWSSENNGFTTHVDCRWIANNSFIERSFKVTSGDKTISSGLQIIGWNPQSDHIQSWTFSGDGSHAVSQWNAIAGGWDIDARGTLADGTPTIAVTKVVPLDNNGFSWQSTGRRAGRITLPDTDEIILRRVTNSK